MIAMALICNPQLLIADEPTTALDVTVQKEILSLLKTKQKSNKMSILFISHDLSLVAQFADRVMVMHRGELIENEKTTILFKNPRFAYTRGLLFARPQPDKRLERLPSVSDFTLAKKSFKVVSAANRKKVIKYFIQSPLFWRLKIYIKNIPLIEIGLRIIKT